MRNVGKFPEPQQLGSWKQEMDTIANHIKQKACSDRALSILEAGCGRKWGLDLEDVQYTLTGIDIDQSALDIRKNHKRDLDIIILGDLRTVALRSEYDIIYCNYVLEHIDGAEGILENFARWLKPGGILILRIPNRDSAAGFLTRITPFWFHIFYKKYIQGFKNAGKPGYAPYPTFYDEVVSRSGIYEFCEKHGLSMRAEYSLGHQRKKRRVFVFLSRLLVWIVHLASFGGLSVKYSSLTYVIEKP